MKKMLFILLGLLIADIVVAYTGIMLCKEGNPESIPFLLIPLVILVPFHWLAIRATKEQLKKK